MRHEAIEMVCAHVGQDQEPPPHRKGVLRVSAHNLSLSTFKNFAVMF